MSYGALFCQGLNPLLANLKALVAEADRLGVGDWTAAVSAKAVYEDIDGFVLYTPFGGESGDCARHQREVQAAINSISILLRATPGASLAVPRPDAGLSSEGDLLPTWAKFAGFAVLGVVALHYLSPLISGFAPARRKLSAYRRRK